MICHPVGDKIQDSKSDYPWTKYQKKNLRKGEAETHYSIEQGLRVDEKGERGKLLLSCAEAEVEESTLTQLSRPPGPYRYSDLLIQGSLGTQACFWKKLKDSSHHSSKHGISPCFSLHHFPLYQTSG